MRSPRWLHLVLSLLLAATVFCLGWFAKRYQFDIDVTANARHQLAEQSVDVARAMAAPVEVIAVLGPDPSAREGVRDLMARYQNVKPDLSLRFLNPDTNPTEARALNAAPGGELIVRSAGRERRLQALSERSFTGALRQLGRDGERVIGFITGHEERSPILVTNTDWGEVMQSLAGIGLISREISLVSEPVIADDADVLVIAGPRRPYFPGELASLQTYLDQGRNLLWLVDSPINSPVGPGLAPIALQLGIGTLPGVIIDTASQAVNAGSADFVVLDRFPTHPITRTLSSPILLPETRAFQVTPLAGQTTSPLLQTPAASWTETGKIEGAVQFDDNSDEVSGPLLPGIVIERQIAGTVQRIVMIGDADFGASQFVGNGSNRAFIESLLLWLSGDEADLEFVTQPVADTRLDLSARSIIGLSLASLAVIPLCLVAVAAMLLWRRRR